MGLQHRMTEIPQQMQILISRLHLSLPEDAGTKKNIQNMQKKLLQIFGTKKLQLPTAKDTLLPVIGRHKIIYLLSILPILLRTLTEFLPRLTPNIPGTI